ncbi:MAG: CBS domain-containing protein [candidate division Zixibacteria bacterium]|nr:CBS domain-containing protein [candidate division Zixibacteria bacterium]
MRVKTLLKRNQRDIVTALPSTTVDEAMDMLISNNIGCLPVMGHNGKLAGMISDKDIFRMVHSSKGDYHNVKIGDIMSTDLIVGVPDDDLAYIASMMDKNWIRHIPIVEGDDMIGLVSQRDIIKTRSSRHERENRYLKMYMEGLHKRDQSGDV